VRGWRGKEKEQVGRKVARERGAKWEGGGSRVGVRKSRKKKREGSKVGKKAREMGGNIHKLGSS
jgi:hypothetical protein